MAMYIISHIIHSYALYSIQGSLGAIWTGLLQCIRACVVFLSSHYLYCGWVINQLLRNSTDANQCLTTSKLVSTVLVCIGIFIFTMGKQSVQSILLSSDSSDWLVCFCFVLAIHASRISCPTTILCWWSYSWLSVHGNGCLSKCYRWWRRRRMDYRRRELYFCIYLMYSYDNTDGHMTCDVPGYSPPKNKGVFTLKQFFKLVLPHS